MSVVNSSLESGKSSTPRCPACGEPIKEAPPDGRCPLCQHQVAALPVTAEDSTPYAQAGGGGWFGMCLWVYGAKRQRLAYLALIRRSRASTRFVRISLLVFALAVALFAMPHLGWRVVSVDPSMESATMESFRGTEPSGRGWFRVASMPADQPLRPGRLTPVAAWWNLPHAAIGVPASFVIALVGGWLILAMVQAGTERSLTGPFRGQGRFEAALRYGSAGTLWFAAGGVISLLLVLSNAGAVRGWSCTPPRVGVYVVLAIVMSAGLLGWWFWLIRIAGTAPPPTRTRIVVFYSIWTPLLTAAVIAVGAAGLWLGMRWLASVLQLQE
ncbi:MAG: hypothetical protein JSV19_08645 [Phycisphaerales bacterium]|nr:MAG: hypothetical protein JSV19_08645 [Phycisphaerales bacterium]